MGSFLLESPAEASTWRQASRAEDMVTGTGGWKTTPPEFFIDEAWDIR